MRIISGKYKGKRLVAPKKLPVRPTTDFAKEGLFNILGNQYYFDEINVLDLFAGTGNISYEFASRGTLEVTSVDAHYGCVKYINQIAEELDLPISTIKSDVFKYLSAASGAYDLIFADPPYAFDKEQFAEIISKIFENNLLKPKGIFILEHPKQTDVTKITGFQESRRYGGSVFSFFKK